VAVGVGEGSDAVGVGVAAGTGAVAGVDCGVGVGRGVASGLGVGLGVGRGVGAGVGFGVGGTVIVTEPPANTSSNRSRLIAWNWTEWVPAGSLPLQRNRTSRFQSGDPPTFVIAWVEPATVTLTQSAGEPSRFR